MLPLYHIIGNVTQKVDGSIQLENINDASGVTYYKGLYHVWHQCCQNHFDHAISKDLIHWQRLPPPIEPVEGQRTFDGSVSILPQADGGPVILYDAPDRIPQGWPGCGECMLSLARLDDTNDKYLKTFIRDSNADPVKLNLGGRQPIDFPSTIWKNGDHYNFIAQGTRFTTKNHSFTSWSRVAPDMIGCGERGGQWWIPTPNQIDGSPPPAGTPNYLVNCGGGANYLLGNYFPNNESFIKSGKSARLEYGTADWWGAQGGDANNNRMMMIGWVRDWGGPAGPGINALTRLSALREVNWDVKTENLVSNPVPELAGLRTKSLASTTMKLAPANAPHIVPNTGDGSAASSDTIIKFSGFSRTASTTFGACVLGNGTTASGMGITITVNPTTTAGQLVANIHSGACKVGSGNQNGGITQLFDDTELTVRVLADRSVADWFVQGGRWAASDGWQAPKPRLPADSNVLLWSGDATISAQVNVYELGCGWLNPSYTENPTLATLDSDGDIITV